MAVTTSQVVHNREDLANIINDITPEDTYVYSTIEKTKATGTRHENLTEELSPPNSKNAFAENATFEDSVMTVPERLGNYTQISRKVVGASGTLRAINTAGSQDEFVRQVKKAGVEIRRDIEAGLVSENASVASPVRFSAGMEAWISTNALHGTGGSTPGYNGNVTPSPVDGTTRVFTEAMFQEAAQKAWVAGGKVTKVIAPPALKQVISTFSGNATKYTIASDKKTTAGVDVYVSDFETHSVIPHRYIRSTTVIMFDPDLWALATLRNFKVEDVAKVADGDRKALITEWTLESKNQRGNAKIADLKAR
ncbi:UNVERIFIED_ORG: hypothetical protein M2438_002491 [Methylobacterium sp. SuP10 SLI 274]|uniref:SU10 major capsid protein n=1 Tax=Methylorubrum extorquens TaxID=408 RepID=UPI0020A0B4E6|nr:DUF5309 family protein [Methylorubrum extorquens]MDF9863715.1 hypothetical protein [Methylorubrum pseudosasae]MDH6637316.1 hypothetical protein [Methylobacterium sp. SuP10 SLI 274]MDH6666495.1 hypothetical protein [Methylorubrum zatmanii]MCP1558407.1 hypothetical protein [Methylorubrum extorquens]MDF9792025.1 hypothetical protein [Methylorubrum extorquens]